MAVFTIFLGFIGRVSIQRCHFVILSFLFFIYYQLLLCKLINIKKIIQLLLWYSTCGGGDESATASQLSLTIQNSLNYLRKLSCFYDTATLYEITQLSFRIQNYVIICVNCEGDHFVVKFRKIIIFKLINKILIKK